MNKNDIDRVLTTLKQNNPKVPIAVYTSLEKHLNGKFGSSALTAGEISALAKELLTASTPVAPEGDAHEDK